MRGDVDDPNFKLTELCFLHLQRQKQKARLNNFVERLLSSIPPTSANNSEKGGGDKSERLSKIQV